MAGILVAFVFDPGPLYRAVLRPDLLSIVIPASVEILEEGCLAAERLESVSFERGSRLRRIEHYVFRDSLLRSVLLPASTEFVHGSALTCEYLARVGIEEGSQHYVSDFGGWRVWIERKSFAILAGVGAF
jgi:hypothetical protein